MLRVIILACLPCPHRAASFLKCLLQVACHDFIPSQALSLTCKPSFWLCAGQEWMARLADQAHSQHQQARANTASAARASALSGMSTEAARPAQQVAGELLRQQLQLLTVDSQEAELALLVKLVKLCTATLGLMTALCGGPAESSTTWLPQGTVAGMELPGSCLHKDVITDSAAPCLKIRSLYFITMPGHRSNMLVTT